MTIEAGDILQITPTQRMVSLGHDLARPEVLENGEWKLSPGRMDKVILSAKQIAFWISKK